MKKQTWTSLDSSKLEAFEGRELQKTLMAKIKGGEVYNKTAGSKQERVKYDAEGRVVSCEKRYDTQVTDFGSLSKSYVWGDWLAC